MPHRILGTALAAALTATTGPLAAQDALQVEAPLVVEMNKFEPAEDGAAGCRAFFLFRNGTGLAFEDFEMSLAILDGEGVIDRLLTIDAAPLPVARTTLKLFEIPEIGCESISEVLLHDIPACRPQNAEAADCFGVIELVSRTRAPLVR